MYSNHSSYYIFKKYNSYIIIIIKNIFNLTFSYYKNLHIFFNPRNPIAPSSPEYEIETLDLSPSKITSVNVTPLQFPFTPFFPLVTKFVLVIVLITTSPFT